MRNAVLAPSAFANVNKESLLLPNVSNLLIGPSKQNHKLIEKQNLQLLTWTVSG